MALTFQAARYHRNGVAGAGYHTIRFMDGRDRLSALVFEAEAHCAIQDENGDSWRCEDYEPALRAFIASPMCDSMCWPSQFPANDAA